MKIGQLYTVALAILVLGSCKVSKDIGTPAQAAPAHYRETAAVADSANIADIRWNEFFVNKELRTLIDSALVNNHDMQIALKNREAAQLIAKQSRSLNLPEAKLQVSGAINRPSDNSLNGISLSQFLGKSYIEDYSANVSLSWEADIWGKIKNQQSKALASYLQTGEARKAIRTDLIANIAKGYYRLLMLDEQVSIAKKNLLLNDSVLNIIKLQYNAGQVTSLAIQQATAQRLEASELIPQLEQAIALEENRLSVLSGVSPQSIRRSGNIYELVYAGNLSAGVPAALVSNRPDVKTKELDLVIANANTGIARAAMYPSLNIGVTGGINSFLASNWFSIPASLFINGIAGITQPLFQQGRLKTKYKVSEAEREKTVIAFRQSVLLAVGEVSDAMAKLNKLQEQKAIAQSRVNTLEQSIGNAKLLFSNGMANYLEVITAQGNVLQGELSLASLQQQQSAAVIDLYRSLGGGWKD